MKCSSCGAEIKEGAEFCVVCGKPLPKRKKCPKCGTEVLEDVMFCTNCGNRFEQKPEPVVYYDEKEDSNPWKWVAIALVALLLLGGGAFWYFYMMPQNSSAESSTELTGAEQVSSDAATDDTNEEVSENHVADNEQNTAEPEPVDEEAIDGPVVMLRVNGASGKCDSDHGVVYKASNLIDGNIRTCWALDIRDQANYKSQGFGPVRFSINCSQLDHIVVYNGYQKNDRNYWGNPRAKTIAMYNADNMSSPILDSSLEDTKDGQQVYAIDNSANRHISEILMYFPGDDYYYPAEWNDLSISEIEFYGVK